MAAAFEIALERCDGTGAGTHQDDLRGIDREFGGIVQHVTRHLEHVFGRHLDGAFKRLDHPADALEPDAAQTEPVVGRNDHEPVVGKLAAQAARLEVALVVFDKAAAVGIDDAAVLVCVVCRKIEVHFQGKGVVLEKGDGFIGLESGAVEGGFLRKGTKGQEAGGEEG